MSGISLGSETADDGSGVGLLLLDLSCRAHPVSDVLWVPGRVFDFFLLLFSLSPFLVFLSLPLLLLRLFIVSACFSDRLQGCVGDVLTDASFSNIGCKWPNRVADSQRCLMGRIP